MGIALAVITAWSTFLVLFAVGWMHWHSCNATPINLNEESSMLKVGTRVNHTGHGNGTTPNIYAAERLRRSAR